MVRWMLLLFVFLVACVLATIFCTDTQAAVPQDSAVAVLMLSADRCPGGQCPAGAHMKVVVRSQKQCCSSGTIRTRSGLVRGQPVRNIGRIFGRPFRWRLFRGCCR